MSIAMRHFLRMDDRDLKSERVQLVISPRELEAIDEWAWDNRIRSRSEAIRRLVEAGLDILQKPDSTPS